ncbi:Bacteriorhodopsin-like protein [seawater metagenome]|uniref:Bacteriorhodopsin-like protein n=1 Tax=seawater metagenome TaxID=1561972 RepID=A0A5E8CKY4_9ZZZZ
MLEGNLQNILLKVSFYVTFAFLVTTGTITFIESISTQNPLVRHALNLETCISIVAAYFYGKFMKKLKIDETDLTTLNNEEFDFKDINQNRYMDWAITTPLMLLVLLIVFGINANGPMPSGKFFGLVLLLNYLMLLCGFASDVYYSQYNGTTHLLGFIFYALMYGVIGHKYIFVANPVRDNNIIYYAFVIMWAFYGVFHGMGEKVKNIGYNILDLFAKCFVGIFFWAYLTKAMRLLGNTA